MREAFLDSFGVMLAGSREESAQLAARWVRSQGSARAHVAVIAQRDFRTSPANAALANGVAAHTLDYDHFGHQSAVMVPCVLAAGEAKGVSGRELIEAYIVGVEVSTLLAKGMGEEAQELGLHPAGVCGSLGATAAAAKIFGLNAGADSSCARNCRIVDGGAKPELRHDGETAPSRQRRAQRDHGGRARSIGIYGQSKYS